MRWPVNASLDPATRGTAKSGKSHRDLAEKCRYHMVPVVLDAANAATASTIRPPTGVIPGLRGDDLPLDARQQQLPFGQGQTQTGDITEVIRPVDLHDVGALLPTISPGFYQPHNPGHASTPSQRIDVKTPAWRSHPQSCGSPLFHRNPLRGRRARSSHESVARARRDFDIRFARGVRERVEQLRSQAYLTARRTRYRHSQPATGAHSRNIPSVSKGSVRRESAHDFLGVAGVGVDLLTDQLQRHVLQIPVQNLVEFNKLRPQNLVDEVLR